MSRGGFLVSVGCASVFGYGGQPKAVDSGCGLR